jgi:class 3 adenylate cyclase/predicted ATPase
LLDTLPDLDDHRFEDGCRTMDVGSWLRSLGLDQYEANFRDNKIDSDLLPRLTDAGLKDIGVSALGDRLRLLDAIAALASAKPIANSAVSPPKAAALESREQSAERRPITVMFCDLVGSTSLAAKLDAEDWRNLVNAYLDQASSAVTDFGGHVLKKLGDGLMALFGYPQAQENDAERAVRAALAIQRALADLNARNAAKGAPQLSARIGLESGPVVVESTGEVFGDAPNVAARVQAAAEPGVVLVTASVQRQTAGLFVAEEKGAHQLKGVPSPVSLYRIVRASGAGRRSGARALTPLVGREDELSLLMRRWQRTLKGEGQFVQIVGEPGIGKSRLIEEFRGKLAETPHTWVEWAASQLLQNTPLHPLAEWGRLRYGGADASDEQKLTDLENTLRLIGLDAAEYAPLLAPLFDVALPEDRAAKFAPEELRRRQLAAMTALFLAGARSQPIVLAFEDLHWADPTSLDLLRALVERGAQAPLLIVATTRPEFRPDWSLRSHHSVISLAPLDRAQVRRMVGEIAASHALPAEVVDGVEERTGGVPLFVEEVTRLLLERGAGGGGGVQTIPPTLQQSLAARLDRLGEAREVAQIGAVIGRDFSYPLLEAVAGFEPGRLQAALDRLVDSDLVIVEGAPPVGSYRFKHALIRDAAYDSLLKSRRQALHRRAADALRDANAEPEAIAHHFTEAGLDNLAVEWWGKAGDEALRRSAFKEAIAHLGKAIAMADKAGATGQRAKGGSAAPNQRLTQLNIAYGNALFQARGFSAPETTEAFARARETASGDKDAPERLAADFGLWVGSFARGELPSMRTHAAAFLSDVDARPESPEAGVAHRAAGVTCWFAGEYREARDHLERALAFFQLGRDDDLAFRFGHDPGVAAMFYLAIVVWPLGDIDRAISLIDRMQTRFADLTHVGTLALGRAGAGLFELMRGDHARAAPNASELSKLAREHDLPMYRALVMFLEGWATAASGAVGGGLADMGRGVELLKEQNVLWFDGLLKIALAEAEARAGDTARAIAILDETLAASDRMDFRAFEAELNRARGEILLMRDPDNLAPAEEALLTAIAAAKQQGTRSFEMRAALALAKLYQSTGRPADAYSVLGPTLEGFAPTREMPEIAEAQALLAALEEMDEVKAEAARRRRITQLHAAYGNAMILAHGYGARETSAAFERARDTATAQDGFERLSAQYGLWAGSFVRGELGAMRELSAAMLRDCESRPQSGEASIAHRMRGVTHWSAGEFVASRGHLEQATTIFDPERDRDLAFRFGQDPGIVATAYLAEVLWLLGEVGLADQRMTETTARAAKSGHVATSAYGFFMAAQFGLFRRNPDRAAPFARSLIEIANEHQLPFWMAYSAWFDGWLEWWSGKRERGLAAMRDSLARQAEQSSVAATTFFETVLAEAEAEAGETDVALCTINHALAASERTGLHWYDVETHRIRGEILLRGNSADTLTAEEAFQRAIAVAGEQGARSF